MQFCLAVVGVACAIALPIPNTGGVSTETAQPRNAPAQQAHLNHGKLIAPKSAPPKVKRVIAAANRIRHKPYIYGGGHGRWSDSGYDCSGAVSYALHGGQFLRSPKDSSSLASWGKGGEGKWITVYANSGHAYAEIAGYRWDTSGGGNGPSWRKPLKSHAGFVARHPVGH